jgi:membrane-bound lytic murein transglycosylase D
MDKVLKENNQPTELKYLAFALSGMNATLVNKGASGIWQMLFDDAKTKYKLKINSMIDERRDIEKSTQAVALYFKDLMALYNDWYMALTAFKATPNSVNKAIISAGGNMNFWSIFPLIGQENREIVPRFVAAAYIANFFSQHNISPIKPEFAIDFDTVYAEQSISFASLSAQLNIPVTQLYFLNPEFKTGIVPFNLKHYLVRLPQGKGSEFHQKKYTIYNFAPPKPDNQVPAVVKKEVDKGASEYTQVAYTVKSGENLVMIADYFDCTLNQLKQWNSIRARTQSVRVGRILYFYVKPDTKDTYARINYMNLNQKRKLLRKD